MQTEREGRGGDRWKRTNGEEGARRKEGGGSNKMKGR